MIGKHLEMTIIEEIIYQWNAVFDIVSKLHPLNYFIS